VDRDAMISNRMTRATILALGLAFATIASAGAQTYPDKPIRLVVPFPPGGPTDFMARLIAQHVSTTLGQVIIDNRPGAGGTIAAKAVAGAEPDGYTLLYGSSATLGIAPALYKTADYDPVKSFAPIALVSQVPFVLPVALIMVAGVMTLRSVPNSRQSTEHRFDTIGVRSFSGS